MSKNNADLAMIITDDILNAFEIDNACNIKKDQVDKLFCIVHRSIQNKKDSKVLTSEIYNHFKVRELCIIPLDESNDAKPYSWDLQDFIEDTLGNIAYENNVADNTVGVGENNIEYVGENEPLTEKTLDMFHNVLCKLASLDTKILSDIDYKQIEDIYLSLEWKFRNE